jgi:hypothetical protein
VFKKTLIALSVGAALGSVNANAVTFDFTPNAWTTEGAELVDNFVVPSIDVTLEAEYSKDDVLKFEFDADITGAFKTTINVTLPNNQSGTMTLGFVSSDDNSVTYRVTELSSNTSSPVSTDGATFTLERQTSTSPNLAVGSDVRANGSLTGTMTATTGISGLALDGTPAAIADNDDNADPKVTTDDKPALVTFATQYATVKADSKLSGIIDVDPTGAASRTVFVGGGTTDAATISVTEKTATNNALTTGLTLTLAGDFSFLQDTDSKKAGVQQASGVLYANLSDTLVQGVLNESLTEAAFAFTTDGSASDYDLGIFFDNSLNTTYVSKAKPAEATEMVRGSFTATVDASYAPVGEKFKSDSAPVADDYDTTAKTGDVTTKEAGSVAAGAFTLNGASVTVYSMPINNAAVTNYLYVTNTGALPAEVSVSATTDGTTISKNDITTVPGKSITNITEAVEMALASAKGQRATVEVTLNAPACNIVVSAAYKVGTDRLPLETSQTLDGKCSQ